MTVELDIRLQRGGFLLDADLIAPPGVTVIFGPSEVVKQPYCGLSQVSNLLIVVLSLLIKLIWQAWHHTGEL